jgi:EthD domain
MIKMMAAIRRRPGMTMQEYFPYIQEVHGRLTKAMPLTVRRYVQNHVFDGAFGAAGDAGYGIVFHRDSVTELWFDSFESMGQTFSHSYVRDKIGPDGANFSDLGTALALIAREVDVQVPQPGGHAPVKILHFLRKLAELPLDEYFNRWVEATKAILRERPRVAAAIGRCVCSQQLPAGNPLLVYFGGKDMPVYEGVASLWFEEAGALGAFRAYQADLEERNRQAPFFAPSESFFLMAREVPIID